jgi:iron complex transport system permease protein
MGRMTDTQNSLDHYRDFTKRKILVIIAFSGGIMLLLIANIGIGSSMISAGDIFRILFGAEGSGNDRMIVLDVRLPMSLMAIAVGMALGIGGCEMQTILRNPIASPYTLGISSAASFGAAVGLILEVNISLIPGTFIVTFFSFFFTLLSATVIYGFSLQKRIGKNAIILFGVAINFLFNSLTMFLQYIADEDELQSLVFWTFGSLLKTNWTKLFAVALALIICFLIFYKNSWKLTALTMDDEKAKSLGVNVCKLRRMVLLLTSVLSAFAVCFVGTIGFIGLIAPHIARLIVGEDQRYFMPLSALIGAFVLSASFAVSKLIIPGVILPIGLITAFIGIPFFIAMILGRKKVI